MLFLRVHPAGAIANQCIYRNALRTCTSLNIISLAAPHQSSVITSFLQKGFSEISDLTVGKSLHGYCIKNVGRLSIFHANTLISMYSKYGKFDSAWYVFDEMPQRNEATWNSMVSTLVRVPLYSNAFLLFSQMRAQGFESSGFVIASLLTGCTSSEVMVQQGFQIHGLILKNGLLDNVYAGTALLNFYASYGYHARARNLFDKMPEKNVVTWTSLMVGNSDNGKFMEVINLYRQMRYEDVDINQNTFTTVITSCGWLEDESLCGQVLGHVSKYGYEHNLSVANSLISMFGNLGKIQDACYIFNQMSLHDTISWNSMISAYARNYSYEDAFRCFNLMRHVHEKLDPITLSALLSVCGSINNYLWGAAVHGLVHKLGLDLNLSICNTLLGVFSETGRIKDMARLFDEMPEKDLISWNSLLAAYEQEGAHMDALKVFVKMIRRQKNVNHVTFASVLAACSDPEFLVKAEILHALVFTSGFHNNLIVGNALIAMYGKHKSMQKAERVFERMHERDLVTWNSLIGGYADCEEPDQSIKVFKLMRNSNEPVNYITLINVLSSCVAPNYLLSHGMPLHAYVILTGFDSDDYVKNSLITMYGKCKDLISSKRIFDAVVDNDYVSWNAMVAANAHHGHGEEALNTFSEMNRTGINLDHFSFSAALAAAANMYSLEEGQQLHCLTVKFGFDSYRYVKTAIMDMYGKCGEINDVLKMLPEPKTRPRVLWNILISAFARQGSFVEAQEAFHEMIRTGLKPDHVTFVSILSACSHGGLVDEGLAYYSSMTPKFGVKIGIEHCVCVIDLLGRSGRLKEAEDFILKMPVQPNDFVWRSLLAACRIHGDSRLGRLAVDHLLDTNPSDDSAFVLFSNVCATSGKWDAVHDLRVEMESSNVKKKPACSWIKIKRKVSSFAIGDKSHPESDKIYGKLNELKKMIKEAGYVPDISFSLQDLDEEQKEDHLWKHSERLALAYGLVNTPDGSGVQIFKNLRVCGDCHSVFKFISEIERRTIVLRDPFRFHHFSDGKCSCGDYW
ncbi:pentatricopeptide repeat-containing protein At2g03880, mitochondrial-like [Rutidosis leptorrhynchoides]|uniref:pentatricopeptide repeat-containing protein At2g03880, mitochondrial-like n=1 Tax=Rutidosis leptorrhynchoides TaxID=125765 RepID=UPI003A998182